MRLFVAIELTEEVRRAVADEQQRLVAAFGGGAEVKWVNPAQMHLTLVFLGEVEQEKSGALIRSMEPPLSTFAFSIEFGGLGVFPPRGAPRVLWLGLMRGADAVIEVQRQVADRVARLGI